MTPDDVARYRAFAEPDSNEWVLLDALEAAWAERDEALAALARVRVHIDARPLYGTAYTLSEKIRAAIEGGNQ